MLKGLIWFNSIDLYNKCVTEASRLKLVGVNDYIVQVTENYVTQKLLEKNENNILEKNNGEKNEIKFKKALDLWFAVENQAKLENTTVAGLMERICKDILLPDTVNYPVNNRELLTPTPSINEQLQNPQEIEAGKMSKGYTIDPPWKFKRE